MRLAQSGLPKCSYRSARPSSTERHRRRFVHSRLARENAGRKFFGRCLREFSRARGRPRRKGWCVASRARAVTPSFIRREERLPVTWVAGWLAYPRIYALRLARARVFGVVYGARESRETTAVPRGVVRCASRLLVCLGITLYISRNPLCSHVEAIAFRTEPHVESVRGIEEI